MDPIPVTKKKLFVKPRAIQPEESPTLETHLKSKFQELKKISEWNKSSGYEKRVCQGTGWSWVNKSHYDCTWSTSKGVMLIELKKAAGNFWINLGNLAELYKKPREERDIVMVFFKLNERNKIKVLSKIYTVHVDRLMEFTDMKTNADAIIAMKEFYKKLDCSNHNQLSIDCNILDEICDGYIEE